MGDDLELSSNEYSVALVVFFVSYVFFEAPSNMVRRDSTLDKRSKD
jgi:hypothetical protein